MALPAAKLTFLGALMSVLMMAEAPLTAQEAPLTAQEAASDLMTRDNPMGARILLVGPGKFYEKPSDAAKVAADGDVIDIAPGTYKGDVAIWRQNDLTIRANDGPVEIKANGRSAGGKAIWVLAGDNVKVQNITFSGAEVPDGNGAGLRLEGASTVIENCEFRDNQMGVLSGNRADSDILITNSRFIANRVNGARPLGHNIYIGNVNSFTLVGSTSEGAVRGHNVKSRARINTLIGNRILDGPKGASSYLVDLPAGGIAVLRNNYLEQGRNAENLTLVSYGAETLLHTENRLMITGNFMVNKAGAGTFVRNYTETPAQIIGNSFDGSGTILRGPGTVIDRTP
jgi:hypothetical protein